MSAKDRLAVFHPEFREDLRYWVETDRRVAPRALQLVEAVLRDPFDGIASGGVAPNSQPLVHRAVAAARL